jgi:S1-C subfamily serine protease
MHRQTNGCSTSTVSVLRTRRIAVLLLASLAAAVVGCDRRGSSAQPPASASQVAALATQAGEAVWRVEAEGCGWRVTGSAFAIDARHLITNHHVTVNDSSPQVRSRDGQLRAGRLIGATAIPDIAVIEVETDLPSSLVWAPAAALAESEPLVVIGYPSPAGVFAATSGRIVNFQGPNGRREAALSDAPIAKGNSGGPALRSDGSVAGVVTQMVLRTNSKDQVAVVFTSDTVEASAARFIRHPTEVLSQCGLGPDFVPPVPKEYDITAPPPARQVPDLPQVTGTAAVEEPAARPSTSLPLPPDPPPPTATPCPRGRPEAVVQEVIADEVPDQPGWWQVTVKGVVNNSSSAGITIRAIDVEIVGEPPRAAKGFPDRDTIDPGDEWVAWRADDYVQSPRGEPTRATASMSWSWTDEAHNGCPTS